MTYISAGPRCSRGKGTRESGTLIVQEGASVARERGRAAEGSDGSLGDGGEGGGGVSDELDFTSTSSCSRQSE